MSRAGVVDYGQYCSLQTRGFAAVGIGLLPTDYLRIDERLVFDMCFLNECGVLNALFLFSISKLNYAYTDSIFYIYSSSGHLHCF